MCSHSEKTAYSNLANIIRAANNAKKEDYRKFLKSLEVDDDG